MRRIVGRLDAGEDVARPLRAEIEREPDQLVGALDVLCVGDARDAQIDLGEVVDRNVLRFWFGLTLGLVFRRLLVLRLALRRSISARRAR